MSKIENGTLLNEQIRFKEVRCIGEEGEQLGIILTTDALKAAKDAGLDLVLIAETATPPVCKIMDYNKYRYEQEKKHKEAKKKQKVIEVKEIKLSAKIAANDIAYKVKHAREFLTDGKHVKFRVVLKGRETENPKPAFELLSQIFEGLSDIGERDKDPVIEGRFVSMMMLPRKNAIKSKKGETHA